MSEAYNKLIKTLQSLFEMDKADLDFGIYRIMNQKRDEIRRFLEDDLLAQVREAFADFADSSQASLKQELQEAIEQARKFGAPDPENTEAAREIRQKLAASVDITAVEKEDSWTQMQAFPAFAGWLQQHYTEETRIERFVIYRRAGETRPTRSPAMTARPSPYAITSSAFQSSATR